MQNGYAHFNQGAEGEDDTVLQVCMKEQRLTLFKEIAV